MAKVVVVNHVTLDGVMQAPARPDEGTRNGFAHGGWAAERTDPAMAAKTGERMPAGGALLLGRRAYQDFYSVWPPADREPVQRGAHQGAQVRRLPHVDRAAAMERRPAC